MKDGRTLRFRIVLPLSIFLSILALSRLASADTHPLNHREFGPRDGLPHVSINALARDPRGYLWLGTSSGLIRFDGVRFAKWGSQGEPTLPTQRIEALVQARDGSLWVGFCSGGGVTRIMRGQLSTFTARHGLACVRALFQDQEGTIWAGARGGVARFHQDRWEYVRGPGGLPDVSAFFFLEDRRRRFWVATATGVFRRDHQAKTFERVSTAVVSSLSEDADGRVWMTDPRQGARLVESAPPAIPSRGRGLDGVSLFHDRRGRLWIGSRAEGLVHTVGARAADPGAPHGALVLEVTEGAASWTFLEDEEGSLWVGAVGRLFRIFESDISVVMRFQNVDNGRYPPVIEQGRDDTIWIGTPKGLFEAATAGRFLAKTVFEGRRVTALHYDGTRLWVGTVEGMGMLDRGRFVPLAHSPRDAVVAMASDADGDLWVCFESESAPYRARHGALVRVNIGGDAGRACSTLFSDRRGRIWIGFGDGDVGLREADRLRVFGGSEPGIGPVCLISETSDGTLWAGTNRGLWRLAGNSFTALTRGSGLPGGSVGALIEDEATNLWVGFSTGIASFTRAELERARTNPSHRVHYRFYDVSDGLTDSPQCRSHPSAVRASDGRLWVVTPSAVATIDPSRVSAPAPPVGIKIDDVFADQQHVAHTSQSTFSPGTKRIQINYSASTLSLASKVRYRFMLEGFDADWVDADVRREVFYTGIGPGAYRFVVTANVNGVQQSAVAWPFTIESAFYRSGWFYGLGASSLGLLVASAWRVRLWMLKQQYAGILAERARIARVLHDTVVQSVAGMALKLEGVALDAPDSIAGRLRKLRRQMEHEIGEARRSIRDLRTVTLESQTLPEALRNFGETTTAGAAIKFEMLVDGDVASCPRDVQEEILRIGQEAISNAARHSAARRLRAVLCYSRDSVRLTVSDDGCGFDYDPADSSSEHWGVRGMQERARRVGGVASLRSSVGAGTEVDARVPLMTGQPWV